MLLASTSLSHLNVSFAKTRGQQFVDEMNILYPFSRDGRMHLAGGILVLHELNIEIACFNPLQLSKMSIFPASALHEANILDAYSS